MSIDDRQIERHPDYLFYSEEVKVFFDSHTRSGILVIYQGIAYFISKDPDNLRRNSWNKRLARALFVEPFGILDDVEKVLLPSKSLNNSK